MKYSELLKLLNQQANVKIKREGSSHTILDINGKIVPFPRHKNEEVPKGTLHSILKAAGLR